MEQFNLLKDSYLMLQSPSYWIKVKRESKFQDSIMIRMLLQNVMFRKFFIGSCFVSGTNWIGEKAYTIFLRGSSERTSESFLDEGFRLNFKLNAFILESDKTDLIT